MFNMLDIDQDGRISVDELKQVFSSEKADFGADNSQMIKSIMNEVDKNHDNYISHEEFNDALTCLLR